jgi:putative transcriptional regulator
MNNIISQVIRQKEMTQGHLAQKVGIKREYLNRIIHRKITPSIPLGIRIARALDMQVEDVFVIEQ